MTREFTPDRFLNHGEREFGGYDAVVLWHAYPVIGIDGRNQFDLYRDAPGIDGLVAALRARGVKVMLDYNPWDTGTRPEDHQKAVRELVGRFAADGLFLDTLKAGDAWLAELGVALESESAVPLDRVRDHAMSWAQWFADSSVPGVVKTKWFERRHMLHHTRRWHRDHSEELHSAFMNGCGILVWENVFGSWAGWNPRDRALLRAMLPVQRRFADLFATGEWTPLADEAAASLPASRWRDGDVTLWTIVNRSEEPYTGPLIGVAPRPGLRYLDLMAGEELGAGLTGAVPARGVTAVLAVPEVTPDIADLLVRQRAERARWTGDTSFPARPPVRTYPLTGEPRTFGVTYRERECGFDGEAPYVDEWKPLPPRLHALRTVTRDVRVENVTVAPREVTNAEYAAFTAATGHPGGRREGQPGGDRDGLPGGDRDGLPGGDRDGLPGGDRERWPGGHRGPAAGDSGTSVPAADRDAPGAPVTGVTLEDARAYAAWAGTRLPTEYEWQAAAASAGFVRLSPLVWNLTESEHTDGRTRFVMLKGGGEAGATGSEWYVDAGPQPSAYTLKLLRTHPELERSPNIGFRCVVPAGDKAAQAAEATHAERAARKTVTPAHPDEAPKMEEHR
ncbi:SUMF1/EgtB/PvdO family nonheme iron enzyme [Sphaerisporangium flaviroseum]|uniref:SUMF1/EgtB/PvdO family nonheme iron enzyme n=1 Tax=Sphaerisporangium flaviroseum TaxID=509199 RepID=UPI0031EE0DC3